MKTIVPDTSILIHGHISEEIVAGKLKEAKILIPRAALDELQAQASRGMEIGFKGLEEIKTIRAHKGKISVEFTGQRPTLEEIQLAKKGRIDAIIRDAAAKNNGTLFTSDYVQALVGEAEGVSVEYIPKHKTKGKVRLEDFFDSQTQSVHIKVGTIPLAKKGKPGSVKLSEITKKKTDLEELEGIIDEIMAKVREDENSFIEIGKQGALVVQMGKYRICISKPPFSEALELTAVRPLTKVALGAYNAPEELKKFLSEKSVGVLIAGEPGAGKTSFAVAVAEYLEGKKKIIKTFEQPRDLDVGPGITQYSPLEGSWEKTADILLLARPDYTIFDEIRNTKDFRVFGDMRLAGVGMIGVIHASTPVSAIQRFIGRMELGIIPHVINTTVYIKDGKIEKILELSLVVKVPSGMKEADLARPVVEIRDFSTKDLEYEIYTFGEENVIIPVKSNTTSAVKELASQRIYQEIRSYDPDAEITLLSESSALVRVDNEVIARLIGKKGKNIEVLEDRLGIHLSVEPFEPTLKAPIRFDVQETGAYIGLQFKKKLIGEQVDVYSGEDFLFSPVVGKGGMVKVSKKSEMGHKLLAALTRKGLKVMM